MRAARWVHGPSTCTVRSAPRGHFKGTLALLPRRYPDANPKKKDVHFVKNILDGTADQHLRTLITGECVISAVLQGIATYTDGRYAGDPQRLEAVARKMSTPSCKLRNCEKFAKDNRITMGDSFGQSIEGKLAELKASGLHLCAPALGICKTHGGTWRSKN